MYECLHRSKNNLYTRPKIVNKIDGKILYCKIWDIKHNPHILYTHANHTYVYIAYNQFHICAYHIIHMSCICMGTSILCMSTSHTHVNHMYMYIAFFTHITHGYIYILFHTCKPHKPYCCIRTMASIIFDGGTLE